MGQGVSAGREEARATGEVLKDNREKLLERGEKLSSIENRTENIAHNAKSFAANARALREREEGGKVTLKAAGKKEERVEVKEPVVHSEEYLKREELIQRGMERQKQRREEERLAREKLELDEKNEKPKKNYKLAGWVGQLGKGGKKKKKTESGEVADGALYGKWAEPVSERGKSSSLSMKPSDRVYDVEYKRAMTMEPGVEAIVVDTEEVTDLMKDSEQKYLYEEQLDDMTKRAEILEEATMQFLPVRQHSEKVNLEEKPHWGPASLGERRKKLMIGAIICLVSVIIMIIIIIVAVLASSSGDNNEDSEEGSGSGEGGILEIDTEET